MTIQEFNYYSDIATKLFNYMNGKINKLNTNCQLVIRKSTSKLGWIFLSNYPQKYQNNLL